MNSCAKARVCLLTIRLSFLHLPDGALAKWSVPSRRLVFSAGPTYALGVGPPSSTRPTYDKAGRDPSPRSAANPRLREEVYELQVLELGGQGGGELGAVAGLA